MENKSSGNSDSDRHEHEQGQESIKLQPISARNEDESEQPLLPQQQQPTQPHSAGDERNGGSASVRHRVRSASSSESEALRAGHRLSRTGLEAPEKTDVEVEVPVEQPKGRYEADKGYAWWVLVGSFICNFLVDGVVFAFGGIYDHLKEHFHASARDTSLVGSLLCGCYLLMGPFTSVLCKNYGCRKITMGGAVLACLGFMISMFATDIQFLQLSLGVVGGMGFGLIYLPSIVIVGFWFNKRRALATGIAVCGSSLGGFSLVPLCSMLLEEFDWRGTTLLLGGLVLNAACAGSLFRAFETNDADAGADAGKSNGQQSKVIEYAIDEKARRLTESTHSLNDCIITGDNEIIKVLPQQNAGRKQRRSSTEQKPQITANLTVSDTHLHKIAEDVLRSQRIEAAKRAAAAIRQSHADDQNTATSGSQSSDGSARNYSHSVSVTHSARLGSDANRAMKEDFLHHRVATDVTRTNLNRRDLSKSFTGSIAMPIGSVSSLTMRTTAVPATVPHKQQKKESGCETVSRYLQKVVDLLHETFDVSLMKSPTMIMIIVSSVMSMLGFFLPFMFIAGAARSFGLSSSEAKTVLMTLNIANAIGRVISGWMSDKSCVDVLWTNNLALIFAGAATMCVPFCTTNVLLLTYAIVFGVSIAAFVTLRSILLVEVLGLDKLTNAFGWLILFQGFAVIFGPPVGGMFYDATKSYSATFLFGGGVLALSGAALIPLRKISDWEKARTEKAKPAVAAKASAAV